MKPDLSRSKGNEVIQASRAGELDRNNKRAVWSTIRLTYEIFWWIARPWTAEAPSRRALDAGGGCAVAPIQRYILWRIQVDVDRRYVSCAGGWCRVATAASRSTGHGASGTLQLHRGHRQPRHRPGSPTLDDAVCNCLCFPLGSRVVVVHLDVGGSSQKSTSPGGFLLRHMDQLVGQQSFSRLGSRRILVRSKHHITPHRVGEGVHCSRRLRIPGTRVHTHVTEVTPEARLHQGADFRIERLPGRAQHLVNDRRHASRLCPLPFFSLQALLLLPALFALSTAGVLAARAFALEQAPDDRWLTLRLGRCG